MGKLARKLAWKLVVLDKKKIHGPGGKIEVPGGWKIRSTGKKNSLGGAENY